jgi:heme oxygenase
MFHDLSNITNDHHDQTDKVKEQVQHGQCGKAFDQFLHEQEYFICPQEEINGK